MPFIVMLLVACILAGLAILILNALVDDAKVRTIGRAIIICALVLWLVGELFGFPAGWVPRGAGHW